MARRETYFLFLIFPMIAGFNIGTKGAKVLTGEPGSMLGYSLDFATRGSNVWLLVGSPKSLDKAINITTGTLYYCTPGFNNLSNCNQLSSGQLPGVAPGVGFTEHRSEMWLGASVDVGSASDAVSFCGPRWMRDSSDGNVTAMNGLCYEVPFGFLEGDTSGIVNPTVLSGLYNSDPSDQFTEADETMFNQTIKYGVSASGLSIKYNGSEIWIGSPGLNDLAGGAINLKGPAYSVKSENTTETKQGQLYGYAVSVGKFYRDKKSYIAIGGPRDGGSGKVLVIDSNNNVKDKLIGTEPGSYFGSVLCVIPGNGDATDYLLVGAPMYSDMQTYANNYHSTEEKGRVYVYNKNQTNENLQMIQSLEGSSTLGSRFGFAIANLNDMNNDGFNDVVIGAPFEGNGQGAVYVYMGYKRGFFLTQTITAANVAPSGTPLSTFGSSFTQHPVDFNSDKHEDLAIGAYGSDVAFVLFTNPPITMKVDTNTNLTGLSGGRRATVIAQNTMGFTLDVCFDYEGDNIPSDVLVTYEVTADQTFLASSISEVGRVCFKQSNTSCVEKVSGNMRVFKAPPELTCTGSPIEVMVRDDWANMRGLFVPVDFNVEFNVSTSGNTDCTTSCPVVNKFDPTNDDPFAKTRTYSYQLARDGCGSDSICDSDVQLLVTSPDTLVTGPQSQYFIDVTISNQGEPSYNTEIFLTFHPNMTLSAVEDSSENDRLICSSTAGSVKCSFNNQRFNKDEQFNFRVQFDSSKVLPLTDNFNMKVEVKSDSNDINVQNNMLNKAVRILTKVVAIYHVAANPDTHITKTAPQTPTLEVNHSIQIVNTGPSDLLDTLTFIVEYPQSMQVKPTKIVLNVSSATDHTQIQCHNRVLVPEGVTNLTYRAFIISINETGSANSANNFDCDKGGTCARVTCDVGAFMYDSFISVAISYDVAQDLYDLINGQTSNVIPEVPIVTKFSPETTKNPAVSLEIQRKRGSTTPQDLSTSVRTRMLPNKPAEKETVLPIWAIVLLAILGSLLFLGGLNFILWKRGFFVRKYKNQRKAKEMNDNEHAFDNLANENEYIEIDDKTAKPLEANMSATATTPTEMKSRDETEMESRMLNESKIAMDGLKKLVADMNEVESHLYENPGSQTNSSVKYSSPDYVTLDEKRNPNDYSSLKDKDAKTEISDYAEIRHSYENPLSDHHLDDSSPLHITSL